ncbi:hypothetical protein [Actinopolyspora erythraea]|uniref:hypothetical protein n=1 Tax=Actinopolyspora erythraea TaxID=414996 RepID=UPI0011866C2D|nr:hypothetical protein [Actinopolyspora erythraea]
MELPEFIGPVIKQTDVVIEHNAYNVDNPLAGSLVGTIGSGTAWAVLSNNEIVCLSIHCFNSVTFLD